MDFKFDEVVPRNNTNSIKWDADKTDGLLPMWVADMDFKTAPAVIDALQKRVSHGVFGYTLTPDEFYFAIINWWQGKHNLTLKKDWIIPVTGVIPALSVILRSLLKHGDKVMIQPPVYNHFYTTITNCGCEIVENNLIYKGGAYSIDFEDLENKAADPDVKMLVISNPHNPAGRVWTKEELQRVAQICLNHQVLVISDEIHSDLTLPEHKHIPFASIRQEHSRNSITLSSPTKTFNLAGLQVGYLFTENSSFKTALQKTLVLQEMELLSPFAIEALIAAYNHGSSWLDALITYLTDNYNYLKEFIAAHLPLVNVLPLQATYLVWLDCSAVGKSSNEIAAYLLRHRKLWVNSGTLYGQAGEGFIRVNIACSRVILTEGLTRLSNSLTLK